MFFKGLQGGFLFWSYLKMVNKIKKVSWKKNCSFVNFKFVKNVFFFKFCRFLQKFTCAVARRLKRNARLEANFYPVTTSIFIQEWSSLPDERKRVQRELSILTDRSQAGASLAEGEVCTYIMKSNHLWSRIHNMIFFRHIF